MKYTIFEKNAMPKKSQIRIDLLATIDGIKHQNSFPDPRCDWQINYGLLRMSTCVGLDFAALLDNFREFE